MDLIFEKVDSEIEQIDSQTGIKLIKSEISPQQPGPQQIVFKRDPKIPSVSAEDIFEQIWNEKLLN